MQIQPLKNWVQIFFDLYFFTFCGSAASYCSLKVTKPPESFKIEAKYAKLCFLQQGLIPGLLCGSQVSQPLDHGSSDKNRSRWKKNDFLEFYFFSGSPTYPGHCGSQSKFSASNYLLKCVCNYCIHTCKTKLFCQVSFQSTS